MPNIKTPFGMRNGVKIFTEDGMCWKCGKPIPVGTTNWSYNTQAKGRYSHRDCLTEHMTTETATQSEAKDKPEAQSKPMTEKQALLDAQKLIMELITKEQGKTSQSEVKPPITPKESPKPKEWEAPIVPEHHKQYDLLKRVLMNHPNRAAYLAGNPGSSKSYSIRTLAHEYVLPYYCQPLCETSSVSDLLGYYDAHSKLLRTMFRECYEFGGILDLPELDNTDPNLITVLNNAIDNGECGFPDGMIKRHEKCYIVANGNTDLRGPTSQFPGRRKQDAATVERFAFIKWLYDESFEKAYYPKSERDAKFIELIHVIRKHCIASGVEIVVSQRAIRDGIAYLNCGFNTDQALSLALFKEHPQTEEIYLAIGRQYKKEVF